jgi:putative transposase
MSRPLRLELAGGLYHVTSRGDGREDIYSDDQDREKWLEILGHTCGRFNWRCHAFCLMDNHYHIVVETAEANLSKGMRQLNGVYTQYFNKRHDRVGHVFQGRYKGVLVEQDAYLLELARYVVLNPIRAMMTEEIGTWKWSSYKSMIGEVAAPSWLEIDWILGQFSKQRKRAVGKYADFVRAGVGLPSIWSELQNQIFLGTEKFINKQQRLITDSGGMSEVPRLQKRVLPKALSYYERKYKNLNQAITQAYLSGGYTLKELGEYFEKHYSTISRIVKGNE